MLEGENSAQVIILNNTFVNNLPVDAFEVISLKHCMMIDMTRLCILEPV